MSPQARQYGGAVCNDAGSGGGIILTNAAFTGNHADGNSSLGGAIFNVSGSVILGRKNNTQDVVTFTFTGNHA